MHATVHRSVSSSLAEAYHRDGIVFPFAVLPPARVAALRSTYEALEAGLTRNPIPMRWTHLCFAWAYDLALESSVLDAVEALLGPEIIVMGTIILCKHPGHGAYVGWHQDHVHSTAQAAPAVSAWIALADSTLVNGCMRVIPATHHKLLEHCETRDADNLLRAGRVLAQEVDKEGAIDVELRAGEMSLHHDRIVHGSGPNRGDDKRIGFVVRYTTPAAESRGFPAVRARGSADCSHLEFAARPPDRGADEALASYLQFVDLMERAIGQRGRAANPN